MAFTKSNQAGAEQRVLTRVRTAQRDATSQILENKASVKKCRAIADNAQGFARSAANKHRHPDSPPVACKIGCHWCCYQSIPVSAPEVLRIVDYLHAETNAVDRGKTMQRLRDLDAHTRGISPSQRDSLRMKCGFLRGKRCSIYPVRPLACGGFTSYNVADCKKAYKHGFKEDSIVSEIATKVAFRGAFQGVLGGLSGRVPDDDSHVLELTAAMLDALDCEDIDREWRNHRSVFGRAQLKS